MSRVRISTVMCVTELFKTAVVVCILFGMVATITMIGCSAERTGSIVEDAQMAESSEQAIRRAAEEGDEKAMILLLRTDPSLVHVIGNMTSPETPLHLAARHGHQQVVELLLRHGASINVRGDY